MVELLNENKIWLNILNETNNFISILNVNNIIYSNLFKICFFKKDGFVGGSRAKPYIFAPNRSNQILNQDPLKRITSYKYFLI